MPIPVLRQHALQCASDDAFIIAETIETLARLLDKFYARYGGEFGSQLMTLIPFHEQVNLKLTGQIVKFARSLEPPSE